MKKRGKKAQIATEHLIVIGLVLVVLVPTTYLLITYNTYSSDAVKASKLESAANEIVKAANNLYSYGTESKTTMEISIPEGVESIEFIGKEIIFNYLTSSGGTSQLAKAADVDLFGTTIENPVPGTLQIELINFNLEICVTLQGETCSLSPGVEICDIEFRCDLTSDDVCPNDYFPNGYSGEECGTTTGETYYDVDCG
jgi:uncharacterized protein (UPF0333 family)